ncbi:MAG TPA: hypothetical protein VL093_06715 [Flavipsychrobacter sp.]|nr:hypothetical protein [Flavipsychrobacter sp.]
MKTIAVILFSAAILGFAACGNGTNDEHTHYIDSSGMNPDENTGTPNTSTTPIRDSYATDTANSTNGPDNAVPKSSSMDSANSL